MWTNASLPRPSATWMQIVSIPLGLFGADAGLVTKAMERIASVSSLWNCSFLRWRYLTSVTTGIHFVFSLSFPLRLKKRSNNPNLYKETKNNKLKDSGGWRKMTSSYDRLWLFIPDVILTLWYDIFLSQPTVLVMEWYVTRTAHAFQ